MKAYWIVTMVFNLAGALISFSRYVAPAGRVTDLVWLVLNVAGTYISYRMIQGIDSLRNPGDDSNKGL